MRIDMKSAHRWILAGLVVLMPLIFWTALFEAYELPKWFLWRWGAVFIFLAEILLIHTSPLPRGERERVRGEARCGVLFAPVFIYPWFAFFFFSLLSLGGAVNLQLGLLNIANLVLGFSLFFLISSRWEEFEIKALIPFLILPALPVAVYGIFQAFGCDFVSLPGPFRGAISTFGHRNFVAEYELMVLPLLLYGGFFYTIPLTPPLPQGERNHKIRLVRGFSLAGLPFVYAHFIMTHTRGSYFALIVALLFMIFFGMRLPRQKARRWFVGTAALLLLLTGLFLARNYNLPGEKVIGGKGGILRSAQNDTKKIAQNDIIPPTAPPPPGGRDEGEVVIPSSLQSRILIWQATLAVFRSHPVIGVGAGNLNEVIPPYYPEKLLKRFQGKLEAGTSHNEYLQILAETGILGGFSFLTFLVLLLYFAVKVSWRRAKKNAEFLPFFLTAGVLGILTASLISSPLQRPVTLFLFWLYIGFLAVFGKEETRSFILSRKAQERILAGFMIIIGISAYSFAWRPARADFYGKRSSVAYRAGNRQQAVLDVERAVAFQPQNRNLLTLAGNTYLGAGRLEEAIRYYSQVTVYHPYWPQGYGNLGLVLAQAGAFAEAEKYLKYSLQLDAYQPLVRNTLGTVYFQQGRKLEAKEEFLKALALDPALVFPRLNLQELEKKILSP